VSATVLRSQTTGGLLRLENEINHKIVHPFPTRFARCVRDFNMQDVLDVSEDPDQAAHFLPKGNNLKMPGGIVSSQHS
jgi:hypothetical protein